MKKKHSRENLRIAMLGHKRIPSREGGIEIVVEELATRMAKKAHSVTCYNRKGHNVAGSEFDGTKLKTYKGVTLQEVFTIDKRGLAAMTASVSASLRAALGNYDVVHIHAEGPAFMCWLPKLFGKKVIVTVHGLDHQRAKWGKFASWYIRSGEKNAVRFADEIIVLSKGVQDYFQNTYGRTTRFIPNGVNKAKLRKARQITEKWGLTKDSYILYLGRIVPEKGESYLIEAFKQTKTDKKTRVHYIQNRDICKNVLDLQGGAKGHTVSSVIVLTSELSLYRHTSEFKTPYLDSGIYLMNLLYALTYYGIGTCPLIWNDDGEKAEEIRRFVDIPWSEQIVAIIQVGHYATNECKYAASNRRAVFDVLKIH